MSNFISRLGEGFAHAFKSEPTNLVVQSGDNEGMERLFLDEYSSSGVTVSKAAAMKISTAMACIRILSSVTASLELRVERREGDTWTPDYDHPIAEFLRNPNPSMTGFVYQEMMNWRLHAEGDSFAVLGRKGSFAPLWAIPLRRENVQVFCGADGRLKYAISYLKNGKIASETVDQDFMIHIPGPGFDGLRSPSPILHFGRETLGISIASQQYQGRMFSAGARPSGTLEIPQGVKQETVDRMRSHWNDSYSGLSNAGKTAVLYGGAVFKPITFTSQEAEIIATRNFQVSDVARIWGMPMPLLQAMDKSTGLPGGISQIIVSFVRFTLLPHLIRAEQEQARKLFTVREQSSYRLKYNVADILRGTPQEQAERLETLVSKAAILTPNEGRAEIGRPPTSDPMDNQLRQPMGAPAQEKVTENED